MEHNPVEPTLGDIFNLIQKLQRGIEMLNERMDSFEEKFINLERRAGSIEVILLDIKDELIGHGRAIDKDAVTLIQHDKRIGRSEKRARLA